MSGRLSKLVDETLAHMDRWLREFRAPVVLWSGGKDSTAMLHLLIFKLGVRLPCVQWREPRFRHRYAHSDLLAREWDLTLFDYAPGRIAIQDGFDIETGRPRFDFLKYYQWGRATALVLSLGSEEPKEGEPYLCGVKDVLQRPLGTFEWPWDAAFHGQKSADVDLIKGHVPLAQDVRRVADAPTQLFAMRHWSDDDIFSYLDAEGVPMDPTRYDRASGKWGHMADKTNNADYYPICWNCVNRHLTSPVWCPKLACEVNNISHLAPYEDNAFPDQGFKPTWAGSTVNGVGHVARSAGAGLSSEEIARMLGESPSPTSDKISRCSKPMPAAAVSPCAVESGPRSNAASMRTARRLAEISGQGERSASKRGRNLV